jgi:hypothetical protein
MPEYNKFNRNISIFRKYPLAIKSDMMNLMYRKSDNKNIRKRFRDDLEDNEMVYFILQNKFGIKDDLEDIIDFFFIEPMDNIYSKILESDEEWNNFRLFMLEFYGLSKESESGDDEVRKFAKLKRFLDEKKGRAITFEVMYTFVMQWYKPWEIEKLTIYQFNKFFGRMVKLENHRTTRLYKTVDSKGDIDVVNYLAPNEEEREANFLNLSDIDLESKTEKHI